MVNKQWKKGIFWVPHGITVKPNPIKSNENLDNHGFTATDKEELRKLILKQFIFNGIPCRMHNTFYLKEWKLLE